MARQLWGGFAREGRSPAQGADGRLIKPRGQQGAGHPQFPGRLQAGAEIPQVVQVGAVPQDLGALLPGHLPGLGDDGPFAGITAPAAIFPKIGEGQGVKGPHQVLDPEAPGQAPGRGQFPGNDMGADQGDGAEAGSQGPGRRGQQQAGVQAAGEEQRGPAVPAEEFSKWFNASADDCIMIGIRVASPT